MVGGAMSGNCSRCGIPYGKDRTAIGHLLGIALKKAYQLHHSFVDGMHVGQFVNGLQEYFDITD